MGIFLPASPHMFCNYCTQSLLQSVWRETVDTDVRCNFVVIRYGAIDADFVRVSTRVCRNAHIMQKPFLTRPGDIKM